MKAIYKNLEITAEFITGMQQSEAFGDKDSKLYCNKFEVSVLNTDTKEQIQFDFFGSHNDYMKGKTELNGSDLLNAFDCFLMDAESGYLDFEDFCNDLGYDEDSRRAERIHKACEESGSKLIQLVGPMKYDFINEFREVNEL